MNLDAHAFEASVADHLDAQHSLVKAMRPPGEWRELDTAAIGLWAARGWEGRGLRLFVTVDEIEGRQWAHVSVSRRSRTPSYEDLCLVRRLFLGEDAPAYHVFPKKAEHRNLAVNCLHLWMPLGFDPFPDPLGERADTVAP